MNYFIEPSLFGNDSRMSGMLTDIQSNMSYHFVAVTTFLYFDLYLVKAYINLFRSIIQVNYRTIFAARPEVR